MLPVPAATVLLVTMRRLGVVIVLGLVLAVAAAARVTVVTGVLLTVAGVVLVTTTALGVRIFAAHDLDGVGEHFDDGIQILLDRLRIAGQVDDERLAPDAGGGAGEHGVGRHAQALEQHRQRERRHGAVQ